ncbi:MAG TPA: pectinesterase family protein [Tepidisphaeraceae bacterium]|jgi:pectinesterase
MWNRVALLAALALFARVASASAAGEPATRTATTTAADITVAADGSGDFKTVQAAIDSIPADNATVQIVNIKPGTYHEKIHIKQPLVHLIGQDAEKTILIYDDFAKKPGPNGKPLGTMGTLSVTVTGNDFEADNITFENPAGPRKTVAQTVALGVNSDRAVFRNCRMLANQDTLYANSGRQYYFNCLIRGDVDFIFGNATAVFDQCEIQSSGKGYLTAQSRTGDTQTTGYVLTHCKLTAATGVPDGSVYLGRPWRPHARAVYLNCELGTQISPAGWLKWRPTDKDMEVFYAEYACTGPGAATDQRVDWSRQLTKAEAKPFEMENFLKGNDDWMPWKQNPPSTQP